MSETTQQREPGRRATGLSFATVESIADIARLNDGMAEALFQTELERIKLDLRERPWVTKARRLVIQLELEPRPDDMGSKLMDVHGEIKIEGKGPPAVMSTPTMDMQTGILQYSQVDRKNPHQRGLNEVAPEAYRKDGE